MKILHTADLHFRPDTWPLLSKSLETLAETARAEQVDLIVVAGDAFDRAVYNTSAAHLPEFIDAMTRLDSICPIVAVTGTPTHDVPGSYHPIICACDNHGFYLLEPGTAYALHNGTVSPWRDDPPPWQGNPRLLILGCPEPSKEWFLRNKNGLGREEANQAVGEGIRQLLLGLGGIRKQYAELPCVMVYHGEIAGSTMANGHTLPPGGIKIGREDLALVGADYCALGDIHLAQQIGDLPAYYPGSAYPVNWGEVDQKGFNLVEFGEYVIVDEERGSQWHECEVKRVPFPHPPRKKIVTKADWPDCTEDIDGFQVWHLIRDTPENLARIDTEELLEQLLDQGARDGSRVTTEIIPTETVRAGEIQEARRLRDKVKIWAENSDKACQEPVLEKADALEAQGRSEGVTTDGLHIRIDRLILRGAIGIWKGLGIDEVDVDLTTREGLIALIGKNGSGKTTLIENMHPFPRYLTRGDERTKLAEHFRRKDSYRDLYFTDERSGDQYRAFIQINGESQSGACDYHLYKNGEPLVNGRKADYQEKITQLFGSLPLFLRSAFSSQRATKANPDLSEATQSEKKELFRELAGLDYLQFYTDTAKEKAKAIEAELVTSRAEISFLEDDEKLLPEKRDDHRDAQGNLEQIRVALREIEAEGERRKAAFKETQTSLEAHREAQRQVRDLKDRAAKLTQESEQLQGANRRCAQLLERKSDLERSIADYESLEAEEVQLNAEKTKVLEERERINAEHSAARAAFQANRREIERKRGEIAQELAVLEQKAETSRSEVDRLEEQLQRKITCPKCEHQFSIDQAENEEKLKQAREQGWEIAKDLEQLGGELKAAKQELALLVEPPAPELPAFVGEERLAEIQDAFVYYAIDADRRDLKEAEEAAVRTEEAGRRLAEISAESETVDTRLLEQTTKLDPDAEEASLQAANLLDEARQKYSTTQKDLGAKEESVAALSREIESLEAKVGQLDERRQQVSDQKIEADQWLYLVDACGSNGIQALELDAMGPGIAEVANRILAAAYGQRFQIEFRTTKMVGSGANTHQAEDFEIYVHDTEAGTEQKLDTLSGGEGVWVKRAIYDAFGIIRDRSTGQRFLTCFQDETDGQLDSEAKIQYARMLEAAHVESGRRHTIIVTHSADVQQIIAEHIVMEEIAKVAEEVSA